MGSIVQLVLAAAPLLKQYFTKNGGLNTVSGGFIGAFAALLLDNQGSYDSLITFAQNHGETGLVVGAVLTGLRVAVLAYNASRQ